MVRNLSKDFIPMLSELTHSSITVSNSERVTDINTAQDHLLRLLHPLNGWDGSPVAFLNVRWDSALLQAYSRLLRKTLTMSLILYSLFLVVIAWFIFTQIISPLHAIHEALAHEDPATLKHLLSSRSDLGDLARLVEASFSSKKVLLTEISERKK